MRSVVIILPDFRIGGAQRMVSELVRSLDYSHVEVHVICFNGRLAESRLELIAEGSGAHIHYLPKGQSAFKRQKQCCEVLDELKPDIIHAHLGGFQTALPWSVFHRVPILLTMHTTLPLAINRRVLPFVPFLCERGLVHLVTVSKDNEDQAREFFSTAVSHIDCIENGVTALDFKGPCEGADPIYINVGTQDDNKNQALIIEAFKCLKRDYPDARLILVGDGSNHDRLEQMTDGDPSIELPGTTQDVPNWLSHGNVYVQSSFREGMPMSILEAITNGLPVISTDVGGIHNVIDDLCGRLISTGSLEEMVSAMRFYADSATRAMASRAARDRSRMFSAQAMAVRYSRLYDAYAR